MASRIDIGSSKLADMCLRCKKKTKVDEDGIQCELCDNWFHAKCEGIPKELYAALQLSNDTGVMWYCASCKVTVMKIMKSMNALTERQIKAEADISVLKEFKVRSELFMCTTENNMKVIKESQENITNDLKMHRKEFEERVQKKIEKSLEEVERNHKKEFDNEKQVQKEIKAVDNVQLLDQMLTDRMKEEDEKRKRTTNLIVFGIIEEDGLDNIAGKQLDNTHLQNIRKQLKLDEKVFEGMEFKRLGKKKSNAVRPILITVKNEKTKWFIISKGKLLRENKEYEKVFITPDLTQQERQLELELKKDLANRREESKKNEDGRMWTIKKGKIVPKMD